MNGTSPEALAAGKDISTCSRPGLGEAGVLLRRDIFEGKSGDWQASLHFSCWLRQGSCALGSKSPWFKS